MSEAGRRIASNRFVHATWQWHKHNTVGCCYFQTTKCDRATRRQSCCCCPLGVHALEHTLHRWQLWVFLACLLSICSPHVPCHPCHAMPYHAMCCPCCASSVRLSITLATAALVACTCACPLPLSLPQFITMICSRHKWCLCSYIVAVVATYAYAQLPMCHFASPCSFFILFSYYCSCCCFLYIHYYYGFIMSLRMILCFGLSRATSAIMKM